MILHRYFARRFFRSFALVFGVFVLITGLLELVEQLRRHASSAEPFAAIAGLAALNLPATLYTMLPLILVLATISLFLALARSSELVVTRAAGRSAIQALGAPLIVALLIGAGAVSMFNPLVAATSKLFEERDLAMRDGAASVLTISEDGLWLRQGDASGQTVIQAKSTNLDGTRLQDVTFLTFTEAAGPVRRIQAATATLTPRGWQIEQAKVWTLSDSATPEAVATRHDTLLVRSTLTPDQIRDSFGAPASIPFWELPGFIDRLERAGFSARRHQVWFQMELAQPAFLIAMVLIAAAFTMRHQRGRRVGISVMLAVLLGFGLYFIRNFAQILGENGQIPVQLAAWAPPLAGIALSLGLILQQEDG
ncbi:MAG: lipopolysaccharide export system permease component LptG [Rhodobacteraceae bacterium HLUCCA08]|nr:MAG: lipopolysaccharide export system permease component LptG [Rhodobacteraceae bacterium HLUCCA08]